MKKIHLPLVILFCGLLIGWDFPFSSPKQITEDMLKNTEYTIDNIKYKLVNGKCHKDFTNEEIRGKEWWPVDVTYYKSFNDNNNQESFVLLNGGNEGSSSVYYLTYVVLTEGKLIEKGTICLGDNTEIKSINVVNSKLMLDMKVLGPSDPHCCPSIPYKITISKTDFGKMKEIPKGYSDDWVLIRGTELFSSYYNLPSVYIDKQNQIIKLWMKIVFSGKGKINFLNKVENNLKQKFNDINHIDFLSGYNYKEWKRTTINQTVYSDSGYVLDTKTFPENWVDIKLNDPNDYSDTFLNKLLKDNNIQR